MQQMRKRNKMLKKVRLWKEYQGWIFFSDNVIVNCNYSELCRFITNRRIKLFTDSLWGLEYGMKTGEDAVLKQKV